jgi:hypothetical protein
MIKLASLAKVIIFLKEIKEYANAKAHSGIVVYISIGNEQRTFNFD